MDVKELYKRKLISLEEAVRLVQSNQKICTAMAASEPAGLLTALAGRKDELENVTIVSCLIMRDYEIFKPEMTGRFLNETWFYGPGDRANHVHGNVTYIPNNLHEAGKKKLANDKINIFWGTATPMDKRGYFSLSLGLTYEKLMIEQADLVVLEINENLPWTLGDTQVHISEIDHVVENTIPLVQLPPVEPGEEELVIGQYIVEMIEDGATLQLGIGGIPNAIAQSLMDKRDLGVHTEMFTDGMVDLFNAGVITGRRKTIWKGKMVGTFALGTQKLYDFIDTNLAVEFQQGYVVNDPCVVGQNHKMVSINTALQVDLTGQVCSEAIGNRHYSGTGGQADTHRGAQRSPGGKGIIALRSTAKAGKISTIVAQLPAGAKVTLGRNDIDYIVTEYGVAHLKGRSVRDRVQAMISIAHPDFRAELREEANRLQIW
ncbi:MAG TPA: acetyl-CoA hydrolase/transferase C-terminal domain-containing protein [Limnochordia bacterium]|nr:acetyl-CoA hydrolase/transferase C-terminal domain-containing protein [Limnochordia bacterium]HPZ80132.1 acetyl-CoA hydrolase/transferase C-terminal domain-containing protein [Limnochordia bacterium]HQE37108.1 acetyl-CoA hydrolase/transferase C-terminal domain-containing protein [Limnochordia bacterium]